MQAAFDANPGIGVVFGRVKPFGKDPERVRREQSFFALAARRAAASRRFGNRWAFSSRLFFSSTITRLRRGHDPPLMYRCNWRL